jgi:polyisoprenoid-binding protein YceI
MGNIRRMTFLSAAIVVFARHASLAADNTLEVDYTNSYILVTTGRSGLFRFAGHDHAILATRWKATIAFDPAQLQNSSVEIMIPVAGLVIDTPEALAKARLKSAPGDSDRKKVQTKMLSAKNLDAQGHPTIQFRSTSAEMKGNNVLVVSGALTVRGRTMPVSFTVKMEPLADRGYVCSGIVPLKQTTFGISPESVAGVIRVKDEVSVHFLIRGSVPAAAPQRASAK